MSIRFKFGDIIENGYAADSNPRKRGIYLWSFNRTGRMNPGKHVKLLHDDGTTGELLISADDNMTVVGTIFDAKISEALAAKDAELERLREQRDEALDHINRFIVAIKPFRDFAVNVEFDAELNSSAWTSRIHRESVSTWFGPSDFAYAAFAASDTEGRIALLKEAE